MLTIWKRKDDGYHHKAQANNTKYPQENNNLHGQSDGIGHLQQVATTQRTQQEQLFQVQSPSPHDSQNAFIMMEDFFYPNGTNPVPPKNTQRVPVGTVNNSEYTSQTHSHAICLFVSFPLSLLKLCFCHLWSQQLIL